MKQLVLIGFVFGIISISFSQSIGLYQSPKSELINAYFVPISTEHGKHTIAFSRKVALVTSTNKDVVAKSNCDAKSISTKRQKQISFTNNSEISLGKKPMLDLSSRKKMNDDMSHTFIDECGVLNKLMNQGKVFLYDENDQALSDIYKIEEPIQENTCPTNIYRSIYYLSADLQTEIYRYEESCPR